MKRLLSVGDPHAKLSSLVEIIKLAHAVAALALAENVTAIVIHGDLFDGFARVHVLVQRIVSQFFEIILASGKPVFYVIGNHDFINNQVFLEDYHSLTPYKKWPGLTVVDKPIAVGSFIFCPYVAPGRFAEALDTVFKKVDKSAVAAIFCHQEFRGAKMGAVESLVGDVWPEDFPLVVTGHIHDYGRRQKNMIEVGAPMSQAYGESEDKTVSILDFEGTTLLDERRVDLGLPKKITVTLTVEEAKVYQIPENTQVRINIQGTTEEIVAFKKSDKYTELAKTAKVVPKHTDKAIVKIAGERKSYIGLLQRACEGESEAVRKAFEDLTQQKDENAA